MLELMALGKEIPAGLNTALLFQASPEQTLVPVDRAKPTRKITRWDNPAGVVSGGPVTSDYSFQCNLGGYQLAPDDKPDLVFMPGQDFTVEWFAKHGNFLNGCYLIAFDALSTRSALYRDGTAMVLTDSAGSEARFIYGTTFPLNVWHHIAIVGKDNVMTLYIDGIARISLQDWSGFSTPQSTAVIMGRGGAVNSGGRSYCQMDQFRISKVARYDRDFTPTTVPFVLD